MTRLQEIEERLKAATPGFWKCRPRSCQFYPEHGGKDIDQESAIKYGHEWSLGAEVDGPSDVSRGSFTVADAWFIANAPADISYLLNALKEEREKLAKMTKERDVLSAVIQESI